MTVPAAHAEIAGGPVRLGKLPAQNKLKNLLLADYLSAPTLAAAPSYAHYGEKVRKLGGSFPMYGNDRYGDCTCAAAGHHVQVWSANAGALETPPDQAILDAYWQTGDGQDTGRYLNDVLDHWRTRGVGADKVTAYAQVDVKNLDEVRAALWTFGGLYLGVGLPVTAQRQLVWSVDRSAPAAEQEPYSWGGHCVNASGYALTSGVYFVTWGKITRMTWGFWKRYVDEAFAVISQDWLDAHGHSPAGFDMAQLQADLSSL